jgi:hypothetical protein
VFDHLSHVDVPAVTTALQRFASDNQCAEMERERDEPEASLPALPRPSDPNRGADRAQASHAGARPDALSPADERNDSGWVRGQGATGGTFATLWPGDPHAVVIPDGAKRTVPGERSAGSGVLGGLLARPAARHLLVGDRPGWF